jgi:serine-type D-Ala-D-Ala carboxypeptidase (penicillin-binding protein 5/6)
MSMSSRLITAWLATLLALVFAPAAAAQAPTPPEIAARQYLLIDLSSGQVLAERDADTQAEPASLTKLMTAYLVFNAIKEGRLNEEQRLPVSQRAWAERIGGGSLMFIEPRMNPTVGELLRGMIVQSGNDASVALAEGTHGSVEAFVDAMNRQAQAWGLRNTQFRNVTGLTEAGHYSSARDVAHVAARLINEHPGLYQLYRMREYTFNNIRQPNRNLLLGRDPSVDGLKTGFTNAAGWCLVTSAQRDTPAGPRRLLTVVLGTASAEARAAESQKLLNWGWQAWDAVRLFEAQQAVATVPVWKGRQGQARLGPSGPLVVTVPRGEGDRLRSVVERKDPLVAPLRQGEEVGRIRISTTAGTAVADVPLVVLDGVPLAGIIGRAWDSLRLWIQ